MILGFLHDVFRIMQWLFGLGALLGLLGIGSVLVWFALRALVGCMLRGQPRTRYALLRLLFLDPV